MGTPGCQGCERSSRIADVGVCLLVIAAPFERLAPVLSLPGQRVSSVELAIVVAFGLWFGALLLYRERPAVMTPITWPWLALLGALTVAAIFAPAYRINALKVVARLGIGFAVFLLTVNGVRNVRQLTSTMWLTAAVGASVAALAMLEYLHVPAILAWLNQFRDGLRVVGGQVRATATLQYPTITSMYLEIVFALALGLLLMAIDRRRRALITVVFVLLAVVTEGIALTFTRAGLVTIGSSLLLLGGWRAARLGFDRGVFALTALAAVVIVLVISSLSSESLRLRLTTEGQQDWYRAGFVAPSALSATTGSVRQVEVAITNTGHVTWQPDSDPPFRVSYHWLEDAADRVIQYDGLRTVLPGPVPPGATITMPVRFQAPLQPGRYRLIWDVVQEGRLWFSTETGASLSWSTVTVTGPALSRAPTTLAALPGPVSRVGRLTLWRAALAMLTAHPLLGVGLDNFRLSWGQYLRIARADPRVHSNNMYLEMLAGGGLLAGAAFFWLIWRAAHAIRVQMSRLHPAALPLYWAVAAACVAILLHGVVDSFLTFTPTYLMMSLTLGLAVAPAVCEESAPDADCV
jgi:hypothetical protein